jgi:glycosyltransferase involved in cell wall biosynthesis
MKIAVAAPSGVPFVLGGAERLWNGLVTAINADTPHDAELIKLPTRELDLPNLMSSYRAFHALDLSHFDLVVTSKYPAWMVKHPNHVIYLVHTLRGLYDTYHLTGLPTSVGRSDGPVRDLASFLEGATEVTDPDEIFGRFEEALAGLGPRHPAFRFPGPLARLLVHRLDAIGKAPTRIRRYLAISSTVAKRANYFPRGVAVDAVHPPSDLPGLHGGRHDYFFTASRLDKPKRVDMLIEAMRMVRASVPLLIAGIGPDEGRLKELARGDPRVRFLGFVSDAQLADLYANALAVPFVPLDEDFGLIAHEAMLAGTPILTCDDSGGPTELVVNGINGVVTEGSPVAIGEALQRLGTNPGWAVELGAQATRRAAEVTWERVVNRILGRSPDDVAKQPTPRGGHRSGGKPRLVVLSTFPVFPMRGGGQVRCSFLYSALAPWFDVTIVSIGRASDASMTRELAPGVRETTVPKSAEHEAAERALEEQAGTAVTDIAASMFIGRNPPYLDALRSEAQGATAILLAHPFLITAAELSADQLPIVYDAHNAEFSLKASVYAGARIADELMCAVEAVEGAAVSKARLISCCSDEDTTLLATHYRHSSERFVVIPNGVDIRSSTFTDARCRSVHRSRWLSTMLDGLLPGRLPEHVAVFVASWHPPNIEAAHRVLHFAAETPDVLYLLVGSHTNALRGPLPANVITLGEVSHLVKSSILSMADVALNPMLQGSGTNLKIVDYAAAGVPIVSTPFGVRGTRLQSGAHVTLRAIHAFPSAIRWVLDNPVSARAMATRAREVVERDLDWQTLGDRFARATLDAVLQNG